MSPRFGWLSALTVSLALTAAVPLPVMSQSITGEDVTDNIDETAGDVDEQVQQYLEQSRQAVEQENYQQALEVSQQALELAQQSGDDGLANEVILYQLDEVYWRLSRYHRGEDNYDQALAAATSGLDLSRQVGSQNDERVYLLHTIWSHADRAHGYADNNQFLEAIQSFEMANNVSDELLQLAQEINDIEDQARAFQNKASAHANISYVSVQHAYQLSDKGEFEHAHSKLDIAVEYGQKSISLAEKAFDTAQLTQNEELKTDSYWYISFAYRSTVGIYEARGLIYSSEGKLEKALTAYQQALEILKVSKPKIEESGDPAITVRYLEKVSEVYDGIGRRHYDLNQYESAISNLQEALKIAHSIQAHDQILDVFQAINLSYLDLVDSSVESNDYERAFEYVNKQLSLIQAALNLANQPVQTAENTSFFDFLPDRALINSDKKRQDWIKLFTLNLHTTLEKKSLLHRNLGEYATALEITNQALIVADELNVLKRQIRTLNSLAQIHEQLDQYDKALDVAEKLLELAQTSGESIYYKMDGLLNFASIHLETGRYADSLRYYQELLKISQEAGDEDYEAIALNNIGIIYSYQGEYNKALDIYKKILADERKKRENLELASTPNQWEKYCYLKRINSDAEEQILFPNGRSEKNPYDRHSQSLDAEAAEYRRQLCISSTWISEATYLSNVAGIYSEQGLYREALALLDNSIDILEQWEGSLDKKASVIHSKGRVLSNRGLYIEAQELYKNALSIYEEIDSLSGVALVLNSMGTDYYTQGQYSLALSTLQEVQQIVNDIGRASDNSAVVGNLGVVYMSQGKYIEAQENFEEALNVSEDLQLLSGQAINFQRISELTFDLGDYSSAISYAEKSLELYQQIGEQIGEAGTLQDLSRMYSAQGNFAQALTANQTSLEIVQKLEDFDDEAEALIALGATYTKLGQYEKTEALYMDALTIFREIGNLVGEGKALNALGELAYKQSNYADSSAFYQQALKIYQDTGNVRYETISQMNLGFAQFQLGNLSAAKKALNRALKLQRDVQARAQEGEILRGLALVNQAQSDTDKTTELFQQSLAIHRELGDLPGEAKALSDLGKFYASQDQPGLATVFLKQSVNAYESIRKENRVLDQDLQSSYTETVADTYRQLADVLLTQGRIPEAQRVLDLLKIEEIREFTSQTRASWTSDGISLTPLEQTIKETHGSLIALGEAIRRCDTEGCSDAEDVALTRQVSDLIGEYEKHTQAAEELYRRCVASVDDFDSVCVNPQDLGNRAAELLDANQDAVLVYPLVVEDKLWLLWVAKNNVVGKIEVNTVNPKLLADTVADFRRNLELGSRGYRDRNSLHILQESSEQLYDWLIRPLEAELTKNQIKHLIFAHDRYTRYIPMAALHNGEQYLIEKYAVSSILAAIETDTSLPDASENASILGVGLSNPVPPEFGALENVPLELDGIIKKSDDDPTGHYSGQVFLNESFTEDLLIARVDDHSVLHIATHGKFEPGLPEESFILLGDETRFKIPEIDRLLQSKLKGVSLVVLSACETAYGEEGSDGREIAGISSYFLKGNRAKAVMASLWNVNDASTSLLMQRFYEFLATEELTKAEALRQAQLSLLYDEDVETRMVAVRSGIGIVSSGTRQPLVSGTPVSHPYHWSAFIIIGNSL